MRTCNITLLQHEKWRQFAAAVIINLSAIASGMLMGWMSPIIPQLVKEDTPVGTEPMTAQQIAWLSSSGSLSGLFALPFCPWSAERFGRKITGCFIAIPMITSWLLILIADSFYYLLFAVILSGFAIGTTFSLVPVYISEIADDSIRGLLGCFLGFGINLGTLVAFIIGAIISYRDFAICGIIVSAVFLATFAFMPETPIHLMRKGRIEEATRSLMWLRNHDEIIVKRELFKRQESLRGITDASKSVGLKDLFRNRGSIRALIISLALFCGQHTSGFSIVMIYSAIIFKLSNSALAPNAAAIVIAAIQMIGSLMSTMTVERTGRKTLTLISLAGMMTCHLIFGIFFLLQSQEYDLSSFSWLPLVALSGYVIAYSMGLGPVAYVIASEIFTPDIISLGVSVSIAAAFIIAFVTLKLFPLISSEFGNHVSFFILALFCVLTFIFTFVFIPETKGRSMVSILEELNGKTEKIENTGSTVKKIETS